MKIKLISTIFLLQALCFSQIGVKPKKDVTLTTGTDPKFAVGDIWEYHTRPGEERSRVTIVHIDQSPELGTIIHLSVARIRLANCNGGPEPDNIPHMPFSRKSFEASVTRKVASDQTPSVEWAEGYQEWKAAYKEKKAGIYVISIADAIGVAEATFRQGNGCNEGGRR